jgi:hypothetical protein
MIQLEALDKFTCSLSLLLNFQQRFKLSQLAFFRLAASLSHQAIHCLSIPKVGLGDLTWQHHVVTRSCEMTLCGDRIDEVAVSSPLRRCQVSNSVNSYITDTGDFERSPMPIRKLRYAYLAM